MKNDAKDDVPTLVAIGMLVPIIASLAHEALGHGVGCAMDHGTITLLTFLVFRCEGAGPLADGEGPVGALLLGSVALISCCAVRRASTAIRLFLFVLGSLTLLWFWGQLLKESVDGSDDWGHVARDLGWPMWWHFLAFIGGLIGYTVTMRAAVRNAPSLAGGHPARLIIPYASAVVSAVMLGTLWHGDRMGSALDGFLSFGVAPMGYLFVIRTMSTATPIPGVIERKTALLVSAGGVWLAFALTIAMGVGRLA